MYRLMLFFAIADALINPYGPTIVNNFADCVNEVMEMNFNKRGLLIFANTNNVSSSVSRIRESLLQNINTNVLFSVQIVSPDEEMIITANYDENEDLKVIHVNQFTTILLADYFIVIIDTYKEFVSIVRKLIETQSWNPYAKFIVMFFHFVTADDKNKSIVESILTYFFKLNVINIIVIVPQSKNIRDAFIYSWKPFDPPYYCGYYNETAKSRLFVENICEKGILKTKNKDIFYDRVPNNMEGCILHILAIERQPFVSIDEDDPNIERLLINEVANLYNIRTYYQLVNSFRGERNETGYWDGALQYLSAKQGQILLGGIFSDYDVHEDFECSFSYLADSYTWVAPRAYPSPPWVALVIIFNEVVWYCVIAGFFINFISWTILGNLCSDSLYQRSLGHCFMNTWISMFGFCAYARPVKESLRIFYVFFNLYCILLLTAYQTKLFDVLTNPSFEEQIDTIQELVYSGLQFGGSEELHDLFHYSNDSFEKLLDENWITISNITKALIDVSVYNNFSVLCSRLELAHLSAIIPELSDSSGNFKYYAFNMDMYAVSIEMVALKGFPFLKKFSETLALYKQIGVNVGVRRRFAQMNSYRRAKLLRAKQSVNDDRPLTFLILQGGFLALPLGYVIGFFVFLLEIVYNTNFVRHLITRAKEIVLYWK